MNSIHLFMHRRFFIAVATAFALVACNAGPNAPTRADPELDALFEQLSQTEDQPQAAPIEQAICDEGSGA